MTQIRLGLLAGALGVVIVVIWAIGRAGGSDAPPDGAAKLVPANALAYVHISTDTSRAGTRDALRLLRRFPSFTGVEASLVRSLRRFGRGTGVDFQRDIHPWLGNEAALALLDTQGTTTAAEFVVGVRDRPGAEGFLLRLGRPTSAEMYKGVSVRVYGQQALAFVGRFLVAGTTAAVHAGIDASTGRGAALAGLRDYARARAGAPSGRAADVWVSGDGVKRVLAPRSGALGILGSLLEAPGLVGTDLSLTASGDTARIRVHSIRAPGEVPTLASLPLRSFTPTLPKVMPAPALAFADVGGLDRALERVAAAFPAPLDEVRRDIAPLLTGEVALSVLPRSGNAPPVLELVAPVANEDRARQALARAQGPLIEYFSSRASAGAAPSFSATRVSGITVYRLRISTSFEIDYAVFGGRLVLATDPGAISAVLHTGTHVADQAAFRAVASRGRGPVTSLLFLDLKKLLDFGERTGLAQDPRYIALRRDLRRITAVGLRSTYGENDSTAEISLQIP